MVILGAPLIMLYGLEHYPLLDRNHSIYWQLTRGVAVITFIACILCRKKLFPWGHKIPWLVWAGSISLPILPAMFALESFLIINGHRDTPFIPMVE